MADNNNRIVDSLKRQRKFAWAKVYEGYEYERDLYERVRTMRRMLEAGGGGAGGGERIVEAEMPRHFVDLFCEMADELKKKFNCPICLEDVEKGKYKVTSCGHIYCEGCFASVMEQAEPKCAICRRKLHKSD